MHVGANVRWRVQHNRLFVESPLTRLSPILLLTLLICYFNTGVLLRGQGPLGAEQVDFYGYRCIALTNESTTVMLCPQAGGRVLSYTLNGTNILSLPAGDEGWVWDGETRGAPMHAGRFDIGPEKTTPQHTLLWAGEWHGRITGDRQALLQSQEDAPTGVRLEREFELDKQSSQLRCTQRIINISDSPVEYCHWSRTFSIGKGTCLIPLSRFSKFPNHFVRYDTPNSINYRPDDEHVKRVQNCLLITDRPKNPKLGFDSQAGWLAYAAPNDLLFVKRFPTYPNRAYNEVAGLTISVWYPEKNVVELEPIGPRERIRPGKSASFTETWNLINYPEQKIGPEQVTQIADIVNDLASVDQPRVSDK